MKKKLYLGKSSLLNIIHNNNNIFMENIISNYKKNIDLTILTLFNQKNIFILNNKTLIIKRKKYYSLFQRYIKKNLIDLIRGYCLILNVIGLGFTMTIWKDNELRFNIGYNHLIYYNIPKGILVKSRSRRNLFLFSNSYFLLKKVSVEIKQFRKLNAYKLKGIKEKNELYIKKNWKKGTY